MSNATAHLALPALAWLLALGLAASSLAQTTPSPASFDSTIRPLLKEFCVSCHSTEKQKGELDLEQFSSMTQVLRHPKIWQNVAEQLELREMPPKDKPQLAPADREKLAAWVEHTLETIAAARAGDPGPVVLRRLSNFEYAATLLDLTGIPLNPTREFPADGAAGEGFLNTGNALVMSPSLLDKYLAASKEIASHAILLPDGIRFSAASTRSDWTTEILDQIRDFYRQFTDPRGADRVNLQGIVFDTNEGGRLPLEKYLQAAFELRDSPSQTAAAIHTAAARHGLSAKYLESLWKILNSRDPSLLLGPIRARWRNSNASEAASLAAHIESWQKVLWKFSSVGHIGKVAGPKAWMEPVNPLADRQEIRVKLAPPADETTVTLYLAASDAEDGPADDSVVWQRPRFAAPGRPDLLLRDLRAVTAGLIERRQRLIASVVPCLAAAAEAAASPAPLNVEDLAARFSVPASDLTAWLNYLGIGSSAPLKLDLFTQKIVKSANYDFINGWGTSETPLLVANASDQHVRIPGNMKPRAVALHPSPKLNAAVGWLSPISGALNLQAKITHAHPECGNGVTWSLELRRGATRQRLANGIAQGSREGKPGAIPPVFVRPGDLISLVIGARDANHSCDLTDVELDLRGAGASGPAWSLNREVPPSVLAGNPLPDSLGNPAVWHFYTEPAGNNDSTPGIPSGSLLARWLAADSAAEKATLAQAVQNLLASGPAAANAADAALRQQITSLGGPLLYGGLSPRDLPASTAAAPLSEFGLDPALFGRNDIGSALDPADLAMNAPAVLAVRLPADLVAGAEFVTTGALAPNAGPEGSVQLRASTQAPESASGLIPGAAVNPGRTGAWTSPDGQPIHNSPILTRPNSAARQRIENDLDEFRRWFPAALCYTKIVPVDEVVTLTLFYREDGHLSRLMLDDAQHAKLDRLWNELRFVSQDALTLVDGFNQLMEFATQDADPRVFEPLRKPIHDRAEAFRRTLLEAEPRHVQAVIDLARQAYRRPITDAEIGELRNLYQSLRREDLPHDEAIRLTLARIFVGPGFLYRIENAPDGPAPAPVSDWELASRLSYFLWSSAPDAELRRLAALNQLGQPEALAAQTRRMLKDPRARRLATEFACQWLHIRDFDTLDEKSERHFPSFVSLREDMYEESIRFFADLFQNDGSVLDILNADHTFLNESLASHYGIAGVVGPDWRRVQGLRKLGRGGILAHAATLAKQSGASRTSPILRGNWIAEVVLGEKLPRPPRDVPQLPDDEAATDGLTVRQLVEKHSSDPRCSGCHARIDPFGYALEAYDAIGRRRTKDLGDRPLNTRVQVPDGAEFDGLAGLRDYLVNERREAFLRQFCRKLLGFALGRAVQLSDGPLIVEMRQQLKTNDYRFSAAVETVVRSRQFRNIRGKTADPEL